MDALGRARLSLDGLSVGDAFGERFFGPSGEVLKRISRRELPDAPWTYTDDTEMALSIVEILEERGSIKMFWPHVSLVECSSIVTMARAPMPFSVE
jgi:ADP-ribosylglycohydrolase